MDADTPSISAWAECLVFQVPPAQLTEFTATEHITTSKGVDPDEEN
jgi:hypothetical protein